MALTDLEPFDGLSIITSEMDEIEVAHLLKKNSALSLMCQDCGSKRFMAVGYIPVEVEMLSGKHTILTDIDYKKLVINRVVKCAHCNSSEFAIINNSKQGKDDGQK